MKQKNDLGKKGKSIKVEAINISTKKGTVKKAVAWATFADDFGIVGDAHAGGGDRQVSVLTRPSIEKAEQQLGPLKHGVFGENLILSGISFSDIQIGARLEFSSVVLEVSKIGKECHNGGCPIQIKTGNCIMPIEGFFVRVVKGGDLKDEDIGTYSF